MTLPHPPKTTRKCFPKIKKTNRSLERKRQYIKFVIRKYFPLLKFLILILTLIVFIAGIYYLLFISPIFLINKVRVTGTDYYVNSTDFLEISNNAVIGRSIFTINSSDLKSCLLDSFHGAKNINIMKIYPNNISIQVTERVPLAVIYNNVNSDFYLLDEDGYVLGIVDPKLTKLPKIRYEGEIKVGYFVSKEMIPVYLALMDAINKEEIKVSSMSINAKYSRLYVYDGIEALISNTKNKYSSIKILNTLLRQLQLEGKRVYKIDLRYDKVSVSYD